MAPDHVDICTPKLQLKGDPLRSLQPVKSAEQRADVVKLRHREYQSVMNAVSEVSLLSGLTQSVSQWSILNCLSPSVGSAQLRCYL